MKILNFGSINIDNTYAVADFVRAGETISALNVERHAGGKGFNQSVALARAGAAVYHAGAVGDDGSFLISLLSGQGIDTSFIKRSSLPTGNAIIQVSCSGNNCIILYSGANGDIDEAFADSVLSGFSSGDVLVLQNEISCLEYIIRRASEIGMRIAFNPSPFNEKITSDMLSKATWLFVNEVEAEAICGSASPEDTLASLSARFPSSEIILTLGSEGAMYSCNSLTLSHGIFPVSAVDTTGAGDTFTGFFLASRLRGETAGKSLALASAASAVAVTKPGAAEAVPSLAEAKQFLAERGE